MGGPAAPQMCGQMVGPSGYGVPGGYSNQMSVSSGQMMMGSGPVASGGGMGSMDGQMGVSQAMTSHHIAMPSSQPQSGSGMPGPMSGTGGYMHSGPSMAGQMQPNGSSMMAASVSGPVNSVTGIVSGMSSSLLPASSPISGQMSSSAASQLTVVSTVSNPVPSGPFMSSCSTMVSQVPPSSGTSMPVPASGGGMPNQMAGYAVMQQQHMQPQGTGSMMMPAISNEPNSFQGMATSGGMMGNGPGMGMGPGGVGQMAGGPAQGSGGPLPGPGGMNMAPTPMMGPGQVSQMQSNMVTGGTLSSGSVGGQPSAGSVPGSRPANQFMGGLTNTSQMASSLSSSAAVSGQMVGQQLGGSAPRMPNPSSVGPSPGQLQMSGSQQPMPYGYGGPMAPGHAQPHQMNNMYGWNSASSGGAVSQNMMQPQGINLHK